MTAHAIQLSGLGYAYRPDAWVFRGYSATVAKGEVLAILGPNGRGKTTLLKLLLGALTPGEGSVDVRGRVAFVPQLFQVSFDYSALDMVLMGRAKRIGLFAQPSRMDEQAAMAALARFGMADHARQPFHELSGGQRQLVILARALVAEANILVLDEPTSALDLKNQALILECIATLAREEGLTVVFTTHHPHHAHAVADTALLMLDETDHVCGPIAEALTEEHLLRLYGVPLKQVGLPPHGSTWVPVFDVRPS